jgi:hypothetical protein
MKEQCLPLKLDASDASWDRRTFYEELDNDSLSSWASIQFGEFQRDAFRAAFERFHTKGDRRDQMPCRRKKWRKERDRKREDYWD